MNGREKALFDAEGLLLDALWALRKGNGQLEKAARSAAKAEAVLLALHSFEAPAKPEEASRLTGRWLKP